jgi:hypothetical protein
VRRLAAPSRRVDSILFKLASVYADGGAAIEAIEEATSDRLPPPS